MCVREELGEVREIQEGRDTREAENLRDIKLIKRGRESEMKIRRDALVVCDALILYLQEKIKVIEGEMNTSKMELESLRLEYE